MQKWAYPKAILSSPFLANPIFFFVYALNVLIELWFAPVISYFHLFVLGSTQNYNVDFCVCVCWFMLFPLSLFFKYILPFGHSHHHHRQWPWFHIWAPLPSPMPSLMASASSTIHWLHLWGCRMRQIVHVFNFDDGCVPR